MKDKIFGVLQRVGRSFMLPIAILPVAGFLLGIGGSFANETMLQAYGLMGIMGPGTFMNEILGVMSQAGDIVFTNLPLLFAMGVAIGMAKKEKEVAALAAAIAFFIMHASISAMITSHGGAEAMLSGATTSVVGMAALHNRFYKIELPQVLSFFGGTRFVPIISGLTYTFVGIVMFYVWPMVQQGIYAVGSVVMESGYAGTWVYGLMERALIPFGLHHVFYLPFWQTALGGTMEVVGRVVEGAQNIFFAQLEDPTVTQFSVSATRFMSGKFPLMIFGLPGAALAMYKCAKPEKKKSVAGLLLSAAVTSMLTGITEPIEFTFLFTAPLLYIIHCVFAGAAYMLMHIFEVGVGMTFSGGFIDMFLFGILQGNAKTNWIWIVIVGVGYFVVYYFLFSFLIRKLDLQTPGRDNNEEVKLYTRSDVNEKKTDTEEDAEKDELSAGICSGLGGKKNISDVDCCGTRLRITVYEPELVDEAILKATGAIGVVINGNGVQIIYGPQVAVIKSNLDEYLETAAEEALIEKKEPRLIDSMIVSSPFNGRAADLSETPDEVFASRMMGDGVMVIPKEGVLCAPENGEVCFIFSTKHAIGFQTEAGISMLLHVGIDTVKLDGKGFELFVKEGDKVQKGDPMLKFDMDYVKNHASSLATPILCTELEEYQKVRLLTRGVIKQGEPLFAIDIYEK